MLRPYQQRAIDACREQFRAGKRAVLLVAPTGSGKTTMAAAMCQLHAQRPAAHVVWLGHRVELRQQATATLQAAGLTGQVDVCSIQQLTRRRSAPDGTLVIADEAHHLGVAVGWAELVRGYLGERAWIVGLTATPARGDGQALEGFDALVVAAQIRELQAAGWLVPLRVKRPGGLVRSGRVAQVPVDFYCEHARGRSAVVFAPHVPAAEAFASEFRGLGIAAELVTGETPALERAVTLARFDSGALPVLVNVAVLTEGWDSPRCSCVILARGCGSPGFLIQCVGRGLRPFPGKTDCLLGDLRGVTHAHGRPDADAEYSLTGDGIALRGRAVAGRICPVCSEPLGDLLVCPNPACGRDVSQVVPTPTGEPLYDWHEVLARDTPDKRIARLAKWIADARATGKHWRWVHYRFRAVYGSMPSGEMIALAKRRNERRDGDRT